MHGEATTVLVYDETGSEINKTLTVEERVNDLVVPFAVNGVLQVIGPIVFTILLFVRPSFKRTSSSSLAKSPSTEQSPPITTTTVCTPSMTTPTTTIITTNTSTSETTISTLDTSTIPNRTGKLALCSLCLATYASAEFGWFAFSTAWLQYLDPRPLTATESAHVMSILAGTLTLGRLATAFISIRISPDVIIFYHYLICLASFGLLYLGSGSLLFIQLTTAALGFGFSALWPAWFSFTEKYLKLTDQVSSCFSFLFGVTSLIIPFVLGQLFEKYPVVLLIMEIAFLVISLVLFIVVKLWIASDLKKEVEGSTQKLDQK